MTTGHLSAGLNADGLEARDVSPTASEKLEQHVLDVFGELVSFVDDQDGGDVALRHSRRAYCSKGSDKSIYARLTGPPHSRHST